MTTLTHTVFIESLPAGTFSNIVLPIFDGAGVSTQREQRFDNP